MNFDWHRLFVFQGSNIPLIQMLIAMKEWMKRQSSWSYLKIVVILLHYTCVDYVAKLSATNGITIATTIQNISNACSVILFTIGKTTSRHIWNLNIILILSPVHKDKIDSVKQQSSVWFWHNRSTAGLIFRYSSDISEKLECSGRTYELVINFKKVWFSYRTNIVQYSHLIHYNHETN